MHFHTPFYQSIGGTGTFTFVDAFLTVMEQAGETATVCVVLGGLIAGESLGCPVTATMAIIDGTSASAFYHTSGESLS